MSVGTMATVTDELMALSFNVQPYLAHEFLKLLTREQFGESWENAAAELQLIEMGPVKWDSPIYETDDEEEW